MKVIACSDLHGHLPAIPACDVLLIAGDICPYSDTFLQMKWLITVFHDWLEKIPAKHVVAVWGNHDFIGEKTPHLIPTNLRWNLLQDQLIEIEGLKIYGLPWITPIWGVFNRDEESLARKYQNMPDNVDIVVSHGPPHGILDLAKGVGFRPPENAGSLSLRNRLLQIKPKLAIHGHIHEARGVHEQDGVTFANVSVVNIRYDMVHDPMIFEIDK